MQYRQFTHDYWMNEALNQIQNSKLKTQNSEVPVCALIIKNNKLISIAMNQVETLIDATAHAEILAIKEASGVLSSWRLNECILYSTLEPCSMCMGAILNSRISKVIFGAYDLNAGTCGSALHLPKELNKHDQIEIIGGVLEIECGKVLKDFFSIKR